MVWGDISVSGTGNLVKINVPMDKKSIPKQSRGTPWTSQQRHLFTPKGNIIWELFSWAWIYLPKGQ